MCQMASVGKIHAQHGIPRLQHCKKYCHVCLGSGMRLNIYIFATKKLFRPVDRKLLDFIHTGAPAVKSFARISLCIFICQRTSHCCHNSPAHPVFGCYQLDMRILTLHLRLNQIRDLFICLLNFF